METTTVTPEKAEAEWQKAQGEIGLSQAKRKAVAKESYDRHISESKEIVGELTAATMPNPKKYEGPPRVLDLEFDKQSDGSYTFKKDPKRVAFIDQGDKVSVKSKDDKAIQASLELAREKLGDTIKTNGSETFRRETWLVGTAMGLNIKGYKPTKEDIKLLSERLNEKESGDFLGPAEKKLTQAQLDARKAASEFFKNVDSGGLGRQSQGEEQQSKAQNASEHELAVRI